MENIFVRSLRELKNLRSLTAVSVLIAAYVVIEATVMVNFGGNAGIKINPAFIALASVGALFGPVVAVVAAVPCDILGALAQGGHLEFIFTPIAMLEAFIYGVFLYNITFSPEREDNAFTHEEFISFMRLLTARALVMLVCYILLNSVAVYFCFGSDKAITALMWSRVVKNIIELPIDLLLMSALLPAIKRAYYRVARGKS